jgi:hypothetical protein
MNVSQKTSLASEKEVRKNLRRRGQSDPFKIKCAFKAEAGAHTGDTSGCQRFSAEQMGTSSSTPLWANIDFDLLKPFYDVPICSAENFDRLR